MLWGRCQMWASRALAVSCLLLAALLSANIVLHFISEASEAGQRVRYTVTEERVSGGELSLRRKREAGDQLKAEAENAIVRLMGEPGCREDCDRLRAQLDGLGSNIDLTMDRLAMLRAEIDRVSKSCGNRTSAEEVDSSEVELAIGHHTRAGVELEEGRAADDRTIMDHDLAASAMDPVHRPPDGYPWPPATLTQHHTGSENGGRFPPTGPDSEIPTGAESPTSSGIGPSADSGPGEDIKTSQQMTVSLPQQMKRVCAMVPGPPGSSGYLCSPVRDLMGQQPISQGNFYLQVLKSRNSQTHVPTAISSPNPYAFPTLSGSPVIVPASAASPGQLMPVYNPKDGRIGLQNYPQTVTVVNSNHEPQFTPPQEGGQQYGSGVHYPGEQQSVSPMQQPDRPVPHPGAQQPSSSLPQQGFQQPLEYPFPQYIFAQYAPEQGYGSRPSVYPQQAYLPPPAQHQQDYLPPPSQPQPAYFPPPRPIFQQHYSPQPIPPQVYIPQPGNQPSQDVLQCAYVIVPNSPVQTYKFPPVPGVSETLSRSDGDPIRKSNENLKTENQKPQVNKQLSVKDKNNPGENSTRANIKSSGMNCEAGMKSCSDGSKCVLIDMWCDSLIDCPDRSDEALCSCKQRIRPERYCDGYFDCPTGEDELGCSGCPEDMFSCGDANSLEPLEATCLPLEKRCDFIRHCKNGKDELNCNLITDVHDLSKVSIVSFTQGFLFRNWKGSWYPVCSAVSWALNACSAEIGRLTEIPKIRFEEIPDYYGLVANEFGNVVKLTPFCLDSKPAGTALWVTCPSPECGTKPRISSLSRKKRDTPQPPSNQYYSGQSSHQDEPSFQTPPEVMDFVKNFFNSVSVFDRKMFYKRLWGPLIQPYMGVTESPVDNQQTTKDTPRDIADPSQLSWKKYLRPNLPAYNGYDPNNVFPNYQEDIQYGKLNPYPSVFNYYQTHPNYEGNYRGSSFSQYQMPHTFQIPVNRMKRDDNLRVVGGSRSEAGAWPWVVVLYRDGVFHCGGTILTVDIILTAAHCVHNFEDHYYEVHAGLLRRLSFSPQSQIRVVDQVVTHENYNSKTMLSDVALMHLSQPLKFNRWVLPACLPPLEEAGKPSQPLPGTLCTAVGWGAMYEHGPDPDDLREVEVPVLPVCTHRIDQLGQDICAGYPEGGMDTCQGDSGGPLLCRSSEQKWYVAGIVSHGQGCARLGEPGVYTRVSLFRKWIQDHLTWESGSSRASQKLCPGLVCKSGQCLPKRFHCNNHIDCLEGEDELDCDKLLADLLVNKSRSVSGEKDSNNLPISNKSEVDAPSTHNFIAPEKTAKRTYSEVTRRPTEKNILQTSNEGRKPTSRQPTPQPTTGEPIQLSGATTEEPFLHSHQSQSVDISSLFTCTTINQRIISSRICDNIVDCEDGSDESNCTCKDRLVHLAPDAICNGVTDCRDTSDEKDCKAKCSASSFFCPKSRTCVPRPFRCNMEKDCYFGEDEEDCYALIKDDLEGMKQNNLTKLPLLLNGTAVVFSDGSWKHICVGTDPEALAARICTHLGFGIAREYNKLNISKDLTLNTYNNCSHLQIRCSSPLKRSWLAPLFNSGLPQTLALLVSENWLLAPTAGIHFQDSKVYLNTWLGKRNLTLNVEGIYDQYIHIDGVTSIGDGQLTLLHLEQPAEINYQTVPLNFPDWPTPPNENEKCEALALTNIGSLISISLRPISCREKMRCYNLIESEPSQCYITGIVVCHSSHGPYMTSIISEDICKTPLIEIPDLVSERKNILNHLEIGTYEKLLEEDCDTVRCETGECLDWARIGDGISDCYDSRDETRILWEKKEHHCKLLGKDCSCKPGEIRCPKGRCISAKKFCDQRVDCDDGSDEEGCDCRGFLSLARPGQLCDGVHNCRDKADEDWNSCRNITDCTAPDMYPCHKSGGCIPSSFVCDGDADCPNSEDEEMCIAIRSPSHKRKEGLLYSRLHGQLVPQCHEVDNELAAKICALQEGLKIKAAHSSIVPYTYVLTDAFSRVHLNNHTYVSLRSNRAFATIEQSINNTCTAMYVECQ